MIDYDARPIPSKVGKAFIKEHHYSHGCHNGPTCFGLFDGERLIGVLAFATPCSENVRASLFGREHVNRVTELHRLVILDETPKNTESWFISRALKWLKDERPHLWAVLSFADGTEGHRGVIYQATNAIYYGTTSKATFYLDGDGRLRHPRQNGVNISKEVAAERGWTPVKRAAKHRYCFLLGTPSERRRNRKALVIDDLPYPKEESAAS